MKYQNDINYEILERVNAMTTMTLDCSSCPSKLMTFTVLQIDYDNPRYQAIKMNPKPKIRLQVVAKCNGCEAFNIVKILSNYSTDELVQNTSLQFTSNPEKWCNTSNKSHQEFGLFHLQSHTLAFADETCPLYCPENVKTAFIEAEKAFNTGLFTSAVSGYRKTIDRAVTPLVENKNGMLGQKLESLKTAKIFPEVMLDYIKLVKDSGNFALHDSDHDYTKSEEVEWVREFTRMLLEYIFTLPKQVKIEQEKLDSLESKS